MKLRQYSMEALCRASIALAALGLFGWSAEASTALPDGGEHQILYRSPAPTLAFLPELAEGYTGLEFLGGPAYGLCRIVVSDKPDALLDLRLRLETGHGLPSGPSGFRAAVTCDLDGRGGVVWSLPEHILFEGLYVQAYVLPVEGAVRRFTDLVVTGPAPAGTALSSGSIAGTSAFAGGTGQGGAAVQSGDMIVTEFMKDPAAVPDTDGEWIEIYNGSPHRQNVEGWVISDDGSNAHLIYNQGQGVWVLPRRTLILTRNIDPSSNGLFFNADYGYSGFTLSNGADEIVLTSRIGVLSDRVAYDSSWPGTPGASVSLTPGSEDARVNDDPAEWCTSTSPIWAGGTDTGTPRAANDSCP